MMFIINLIIIVVIASFNVTYLYSLLVAFVTSFLIMYISYICALKRVYSSANNLNDKDYNSKLLSKKEKFLLGFKLSFYLLRLISYGIMITMVIILIDNKLFSMWAFCVGMLMACINIIIFVRFYAKD